MSTEYTPEKKQLMNRAQIGQALECAYIESSELEDVIDNVLAMLSKVRAEAKAEALNEYADTLGYRISGATIKYGQCHIEAHDIIRELHDRANQYKENQS